MPRCHVHHRVEILELCYRISRQNRNRIRKHFSVFIRGPDGFESWKKWRWKISWHTLFNYKLVVRFCYSYVYPSWAQFIIHILSLLHHIWQIIVYCKFCVRIAQHDNITSQSLMHNKNENQSNFHPDMLWTGIKYRCSLFRLFWNITI